MRAALFSSSFPDIKPPEQLTFEVMAKNLISEQVEEEDWMNWILRSLSLKTVMKMKVMCMK